MIYWVEAAVRVACVAGVAWILWKYNDAAYRDAVRGVKAAARRKRHAARLREAQQAKYDGDSLPSDDQSNEAKRPKESELQSFIRIRCQPVGRHE